MQTHDCKKELHNAELKVTPARMGILSVLEHADTPLDVESIAIILKKNKIRADKVTVFRILNSLTHKGLLKPIQFNEGKLRYEYAGKPNHHHFICEQCGKIIDIMGCTIHRLEHEIEKTKGVSVRRHSLEFFGLCANCQE
jgi:Fur family transcriptional regulator, ferric uptake regulator